MVKWAIIKFRWCLAMRILAKRHTSIEGEFKGVAESYYRSFFHWLIGRKTNSNSLGNNSRRAWSRMVLLWSSLLVAEAISTSYFRQDQSGVWWVALLFTIAMAWFAYSVVLLPPFVNGHRVNPLRLFGDTAISAIFAVLVFAVWYRVFGLNKEFTALDAVYFSAVTFSTLGFGDFAPKPASQVFAALQAILGNLHLGFIVGATFAATQKKA